MGAISTPMTRGLSLDDSRLAPSAASVPSGVAMAVVARATIRLLRKAAVQ